MPNKLTLTLSRSGHHELITFWKKKKLGLQIKGVKTPQKSFQIIITTEKSNSNIQSQLTKYSQWHTFFTL